MSKHPRHPESEMHRDKGLNHPFPDHLAEGFDGKGTGHPPVDHEDGDGHPKGHASHPYVLSSHKFTKQQPKDTMKGQDVAEKGDKDFIDV